MGGALASAKYVHGVHAHGVQPCSEPQFSVAVLPSSTRVCARTRATGARGGAATSCRQSPTLQAGPGRQHRLAERVAALLTRPGLQAVELIAKPVAVLGALP